MSLGLFEKQAGGAATAVAKGVARGAGAAAKKPSLLRQLAAPVGAAGATAVGMNANGIANAVTPKPAEVDNRELIQAVQNQNAASKGAPAAAKANLSLGEEARGLFDRGVAAASGGMNRLGEGANDFLSKHIGGYGDFAKKPLVGGASLKDMLPYLLVGGAGLGTAGLLGGFGGGHRKDEDEE